MNSIRDILIVVFLLGSSAICYASHATEHEHITSGLDGILKAVHASESFGNEQKLGSISHSNGQNIETRKQRDYGSFQNSGYSYEPIPGHHQGSSNYNTGYQYTPPNNGIGYYYENPSKAQNVIGLTGENYADKNKNTAGYHYDAPIQNYHGNFNYENPITNSNFKGHPYLPTTGLSSSQNNHQYEQNQGQKHESSIDGYQYERPKYSGYNYNKPQQSAWIESNYKGHSYLPKPPTPTSSYYQQGSSSQQGYSYEKPSTTFKGESYLPLPTTISNGW